MSQIYTTIRDWVESILGTYDPVTYTVRVVDSSGASVASYSAIPDGVAGLDWSYIVTAVLLIVVIYSVFRLLGVLLQAVSGGRRV